MPMQAFGSSPTGGRRVEIDRAVNVGMAFSVDQPGYITGMRFYKASEHRHPYRRPVDVRGTLLASATFTGETASGWQQ